ncbi:MAG: SnoaL-like domain-containing protein [Bacteroidota bacterium]
MTNFQRAQAMMALVGEGRSEEAARTYYADDVTIVEGNGDTFHGLETQLGRIQTWQATVKEMHDGGIRSMTVSEDGNTVHIESWMDVTMAPGRMTMEEVAVQTWNDEGKITHERFYYFVPASMLMGMGEGG